MTGPVDLYLQKYGNKGVQAAEPQGASAVDSYLSKYGGAQPAAPQAISGVEIPPDVATTSKKPLPTMQELLARPDISPAQRARIERLIHTQRKQDAGDVDSPDSLSEQFKLAVGQGIASIPTAIAGTVAGASDIASAVPILGPLNQALIGKPAGAIAHAGQELMAGLEPNVDPNRSVAGQAAVQTAGELAGSLIPGTQAFKIAEGAAGLMSKGITRIIPQTVAQATQAIEGVAARVLAKTGNEALANIVRVAPKELTAATIFQALADPESLTHPSGIGLTFLFATAGSVTRGAQLEKTVARERKATAARVAADEASAKVTEADPEVAKMQAEIEDKKAAAEAVTAARRAWANATPDMRKALMPEIDEATAATGWKDLPKDLRKAAAEKVRAGIKKAAEQPVPAVPLGGGPSAQGEVAPVGDRGLTTVGVPSGVEPPSVSQGSTPSVADASVVGDIRPPVRTTAESNALLDEVRRQKNREAGFNEDGTRLINKTAKSSAEINIAKFFEKQAAQHEVESRVDEIVTDDIRDILKRQDDLGFDTPEQAAAAIIRHPDWDTRWDVRDATDAILLRDWKEKAKSQIRDMLNARKAIIESGAKPANIIPQDARDLVSEAADRRADEFAQTKAAEEIINASRTEPNKTPQGKPAVPETQVPTDTPTPRAEGTPSSTDSQITDLQKQLAESNQRLGEAERRATAAERAKQIDDLTGLQSKDEWAKARDRIDADPNTHVLMLDVRQFHEYNKIKGQDAGDEFLRHLGNLINDQLGEQDQAFRIGGDEFAIATTGRDPAALLDQIITSLGEHPIEGTPYTSGLRGTFGKTFAEADASMSDLVVNETAPSARPVEKIPAVGTPAQKGKPIAEPVKLPDTLEKLDKEIDKLDKLFDAGKITNDQFNDRIEKIIAAKEAIKTKPTPKVVVPPTRRTLERAALRQAPTNILRDLQTRLQVELNDVQSPLERQAVTHDLNSVRREIRWRKPVDQLKDQSLDTHANELQADWLEAQDDGVRGQIAARIAEVDAEFKRRQQPSPVDMIRNERGSISFAPDPLEKKIPDNLPEHSKRIQEQIVIDPQTKSVFPSLSDSWSAIDETYAHTVRGTHAFDKFDKIMGLADAPAIRSAGKYAEIFPGSAGRAQRALKHGWFSWNDQGEIISHNTPGLEDILSPLRSKLNEYRRYEIARYTVELLQRNKQTGLALIDAVREKSNASDIVKQAGDLSVAFRRGALQYYTEAGMFSQEARAFLIKLTDAYVPLDRWLDGKPSETMVQKVGAKIQSGLASAGAGQQIQKLVGSKIKIIDPIYSTVDQTRRFVRAADLNRMGKILVDAAEANPEAAKGLIWKEKGGPVQLDPTVAKQAELIKVESKKHGVEGVTDDIAKEIAIGLSDKRLKTRSDKLYYWRDGKMEIWNISPELADAYQHLTPAQLSFSVRAIGFLPQALKTGITDNPAFSLMNGFVDTFDASIQSKYGFKLGIDSMKGLLESLTDGKFRKEFQASAGIAGGITERNITSTAQALRSILPRTPAEKVLNVFAHPLDALKHMSIPFEEAARLGEFIRARQAGAPIMDAAVASQRVTTNFRQRGLSTQAAAHMTVFLNPAIQSLDTNLRAMIRQPQRVLAVGIMGITLPSIYLWAANHEDKEIQEARKSRFGSGYWYFRRNDGQIGRLKKPYLFGALFGTGAEDILDSIYDKDPTAGERFIESLVNQVGFNIIPTVLNYTLGLIYNKDFQTGAPIAPRAEGDGQVSPRYQSRPETGPTARALGDIINVSPAKIEFAIRNSLGTLGQDALRGLDMVSDAKAKYPAPNAADKPIIGRLTTRYPSTASFNLTRFYNEAGKVETVMNDIKLMETKYPDRLAKYMNDHTWEIAVSEVYADARKTLADLRGTIDYVASLPPNSMGPAEKRKIIDSTLDTMIQYARQTNEAVDQVKRSLNVPKSSQVSP